MKPAASSQRPAARRAAGVVAWWCVLYLVWFAFSGEAGWPVAGWGAAAAAVATAAGRVVVARGLPAVRFRARWLTCVPSAAWQTVVDFGVITAVLARSIATGRRGPVGRFVHRDVDMRAAGAATGPAAVAWVTLVSGYSPNAYVVDIDRDAGRVLLHDLRPLRASEEPA
ncbi:hypothetical protein [Streptomyces montanisoli]|uniref:Uncharacterized protein n=1 Tax=Streptomyces montanisoli TaxID=2798581 RepID=A0A940MGH3_9ACTN|nr:hypothetical protein [Streptomyces montanisoli]MBP0458761.1 hypothetical protein [Streptomyces montanisoli]